MYTIYNITIHTFSTLAKAHIVRDYSGLNTLIIIIQYANNELKYLKLTTPATS